MDCEAQITILPEIRRHLDEFQSFLSTSTAPLSLELACDWQWTHAEYVSKRPVGFPGKCGGVYLRLDSNGTLLYIGLATYCFDKRVWQQHQEWNDRWVFIVRIPESQMFLAPALEAFLIQKMNPPHNTNWASHSIVAASGPAPGSSEVRDSATGLIK